MKTHLEKTCIFYEFWHHFWRLLAPFWESKCLQKSSEILDAFLEAKKELGPIFLGRPGGMRGGPGEDPPPPSGEQGVTELINRVLSRFRLRDGPRASRQAMILCDGIDDSLRHRPIR